MILDLNNVFRMQLQFSVVCLYMTTVSAAEKFEYISAEHPKMTYFNPKYLSYVNVTSRRFGRYDPYYYLEFHAITLHTWANNVSMDFYFYEWLTNSYKRGFVEMHFKACDLVHKDNLFGTALKQGKLAHACPYPPGEYHLYNMTFPLKHIPANFPFRKGRIYLNSTAADANELIASGHIDMDIKVFTVRSKKKN